MELLDRKTYYRAFQSHDARFDGRVFVGVTSTGIYCRPICPARTPQARHVRFNRHVAAAEAAGFRPCKRCRPEISPGEPGWDHRGDLMGRALRLIEEGTVDDGGVVALAARLHITERHEHSHRHERLRHTHEHTHDAHHQHAHAFEWDGREPHVHEHEHEPILHTHSHYPDSHHRHGH